MSRKLPKVLVDEEEWNRCPICGEGVNTSAWNKWKMCLACNKLTKQGLDFEKVKRIRANEVSSNALINDDTKNNQDIAENQDTEETYVGYTKYNIYNFRTTFPPGVRIVTRDKTEGNYLQEVYSYYAHYGENVPEFNVLISGILQAKLDLYRNSSIVAEEDTAYNERKGVKEIDIKLGDQINKTTRVLEDLKDRVDSQAGNIITAKFGNMLQYLHDHEQEYMGIGICSECNNRVIFKTNFPTFKTWLLEKMEAIEEQLDKNDKLDKKTLGVYSKAIKQELTDQSLAKTYVVEHIRQLESSMIESGVKNIKEQ